MTETETKELTPEQIEEIKKNLIAGQKYMKIDWDYRDELGEKEIEKIINGKIDEVEWDIMENSLDYISELEMNALEEAVKDAGLDPDDYDMYEMRDEFLDNLSIDINLKGLLNNTPAVPVIIELYSNYDCINSHHFEAIQGGGYSYKESYFGDVVDALNMNPKKMKEMLDKHGIETHGHWPDKPGRDGKEYISYEDFWQEEQNRCTPACLFSVLGTIDLEDFINGKPAIVTVPKGNTVGFYSSWQGGGSIFEAKLLRDMKIDLSKGPRKNDPKYSHWGLSTDDKGSYGIRSCYGVNNSFFGDSLSINKYKEKTNEG